MMMKFLGLMMQMRVRMGDGQAEGWWMDVDGSGGWRVDSRSPQKKGVQGNK